MKIIKSLICYLLLVISLAAGCDNNLIAPAASNEVPEVSTAERSMKTYTTSIMIKPDEVIVFDHDMTSLEWIDSYTIANCNVNSKELEISSNYIDGLQKLPCVWKSSNNFRLTDITIKNVTNKKKVVEVTLTGNESKISGSGVSSSKEVSTKPNQIFLDLNLKFKNNTITDSKYLESNIGVQFNNIVPIDIDIKPDQELDLQQIQPFGIFALYLKSSDNFLLTNSDGMSIFIKTILLEKCSFIDLKIKNTWTKPIHINGFVAGE